MRFLSDLMLEALRFFAYFGGYGWGIVWLTVAVSLALYPLTLSSIKSMGAMQRLQPKLQELQKKLKEKPQELQKATIELYRSEGVNPLGGCLPVVLKIPFFLALFWAFYSTAFLGIASNPENNTGFLWVSGRVSASAFQSVALEKKLSNGKVIILDEAASQKVRGRLYVWDAVLKVDDKILNDVLKGARAKNLDDIERVKNAMAGVVALSDEETSKMIVAWNNTNSLGKPDRVSTPFGSLSVLALLVGITTYLMQKSMPSAGQQAQMMTMFMPIFIVFICWNFPAGVQLYWLVSNLVGAGQQFYILKKPQRRRAKKGVAK